MHPNSLCLLDPNRHTTPASRLKLKPGDERRIAAQPHDRTTEALQGRCSTRHGAHRVPDCARPFAKRGERAGAAAVNKSPVALRAQLLSERCDRSVRNSQKDDLIGGGGELPVGQRRNAQTRR